MRTHFKSNYSIFSFLIIVFFSISNYSFSLEDYKKLSFEQKIENLGFQPTHIIKTNNFNYEIFCLGKDLNFDGIIDLDKGEEYSSWYRLQVIESNSIPPFISFNVIKVKSFEDDIIQFGFRPIFDTTNQKIYLNFLNKVKVLNVSDEPNVENEDLFSIQNYGKSNVVLNLFDGKIISTKYENFNSDTIRIFENNANLTFLNSFLCGKNTLQANFKNNSIIVMDQGTFGNSDSKLYSINLPNYPSFADFEIFVVNVGDGANDFYSEKIENYNIDYLVLNSDNKIVVAKTDEDDNSSVFEYKIGEPKSYNGPRQVITNKDWTYFYVTTYDKKVYVFDKSFMISQQPNLMPIDVIELDYFSESLASYQYANYTFITTPFNESYVPVNSIDVFVDKLKLSVDEIEAYKNDINIYPNPAERNSKLFIDLTILKSSKIVNMNINHFDFNNYKIYSLDGKLIKEDNITLNETLIEINLDDTNVHNGTYLLQLSNKDNISIFRNIIVK